MGRTRPWWLAVLPIPLLAGLVVVLSRDIDPALSYDPPWLILVCNTLFVTVAFLLVAGIAFRNYLSTGRTQVLLLGCGVLAFAAGAEAAAAVRGLPGGANLNVTIYNTSALLSALLHSAAGFLLSAGISSVTPLRARAPRLAAGCGLSLALVALVTLAALAGWSPPFQIAGGLGFTRLRQGVLGSADVLFAVSFFMFMATWLRSREPFLYWYACALALTAVSLAAFLVQESVGSPVGWTGRVSQYVGGAYFLVSLLAATRSGQSRRIPLVEALTASLSGSEEKFRALAENTPDAVRRFDRGLVHLYANPATERLYGAPAASVIGKSIFSIGLEPARAEAWARRIQEVFRTSTRSEAEEDYGGGARFYQSFCVPESGPDGSVANVLVVSRDLTERRRAERRMEESEERFRLVFQGMQESFLVQDVIRGENGEVVDLRYVELNPVAERQLARSRAELVGRLRSEIQGALDRDAAQFVDRVMTNGAPAHMERYDAPSGRWFHTISYSPRPDQLATLDVDITDRKHAEERLRGTSRRLQTLSQVVAVLLVETDPQKALERLAQRVMGVLDCQAFFNFLLVPGTQRLRLNACAGISREEAAAIEWLDTGTSICGCVAREGRSIVAEDIQNTVDPRVDLVRGYGIRAYACHPLLDGVGQVIGTLSFGTTARDRFQEEDLDYMKTVTDHIAIAIERRRSEQELAALNETLEQRVAERTTEATLLACQLRDLASELAQAEQRERRRLAAILHDHIQQLIVAARLHAERIDPRDDPARTRASLETLRGLLEETLDASRDLTIEISPPILKLGGLVPALRWLAERMAEKHRFAVEVRADPLAEPAAENVRFLLFECARELLFNALKHSGCRSARLSLEREPRSIIRVTVEDRGKGFESPRSASSPRNPTAYGLFSIEQRLGCVGGSIKIDSVDGRGARVSIQVPASGHGPQRLSIVPSPFADPGAAAGLQVRGGRSAAGAFASGDAATPAPAVSREPSREAPSAADRRAGAEARIRVLMVDDNRNLRDGLAELLGLEEDIEVVGGASSGPQAIEMAERLKPDVIAMDLNLGSMDGVEATRIILRRNPSVKIIGLSMYTESDVARTMREAGAVAYVSKGGPTRLLAEAIRACGRAGGPRPLA